MPRANSSVLRAARRGAARAACATARQASSRSSRNALRRNQPREIGRQPADRRRDRHVVVVEDHDQPVARLLGVVHRLVGHARAHRAVADHRDALARRARQLVGHGKAERRADRGRGMRRAERIVFALAALGEAATARRPGAGCGCGRAARSGSCADRPGGRRPRSAGRRACRTHNGSRWSARPRRAPSRGARRWCRPRRSSRRAARRRAGAAGSGSSLRRSAGVSTVSSSGVAGVAVMANGLHGADHGVDSVGHSADISRRIPKSGIGESF